MRVTKLTPSNRPWNRCSPPARSKCCVCTVLVLVLATIWVPITVSAQDAPFGLDAALSAQPVDNAKALADAWANPVVRTALVHGDLTLDPATWRQFFSASGGVPTLAHGPNDAQTNFTITGGWPCSDYDQCISATSKAPATINFQRLPYTFMVGSQGVLQFQNIVLYDIALAADYKYNPDQPYRALVIGSNIWPTIGLAPGAVVRLVNVSVAYRNTDPDLTCEQRVALGIYSLRQFRKTNDISFRNSTAGWIQGKVVSTLAIVDGSNNASLGNVTFYVQNVTFSCLPSLGSQQPTSTLTATQLALVIAIPTAVVMALIMLALCIRHRRKKALTADGSSLALKDVESGISQQFMSFIGLSDSMCKRKGPYNSSTASDGASRLNSGVGGKATSDACDAEISELPQNQQIQDEAGAAVAPCECDWQVSDNPSYATGPAAAAVCSWGNEQSGNGADDKPDVAAQLQQVYSKSVIPAQHPMLLVISPTSSSSQPVPHHNADALSDVRAGRVCSAALTVSSNNSPQHQQQQSGSVALPRTARAPNRSSNTRRLSFEDYMASCATTAPTAVGASSSRYDSSQSSGVHALLKVRSDIAVLRDLKIGQLLGTGSYGRVYKGRWKSVIVAVKVMEHHSTACGITSSNAGKLVMAGRETALASSMAHPNVVQTYHISTMTASQRRTLAKTWTVSNSFKKHHSRHHGGALAATCDGDDDGDDAGVSSDDNDVENDEAHKDPLETWLIMDFCEKGSLEKAVKSGILTTTEGKPDMIGIYKVLVDIASGLDYLHSMGVVHGDLKTANVLLKGTTRDVRGFTCKITDFGLSRVLDHDATHVSTKTYGTITYMPKEVLLSGQVSQTTDVYSFGLMMWELYASCSVFEEGMSIGQLFYMIAYSDWRPDIPSDCPHGYSDLMRSCWHQDPEQRPTAQQLLKTLQKLYAEAKQAAAVAAGGSASKPHKSAYAGTMAASASPQGYRHWDRSQSRSSRDSVYGSSARVSEGDPSSPSARDQQAQGLPSPDQLGAAGSRPHHSKCSHQRLSLDGDLPSQQQIRSVVPVTCNQAMVYTSTDERTSLVASSQPGPAVTVPGDHSGVDAGAQMAPANSDSAEPVGTVASAAATAAADAAVNTKQCDESVASAVGLRGAATASRQALQQQQQVTVDSVQHPQPSSASFEMEPAGIESSEVHSSSNPRVLVEQPLQTGQRQAHALDSTPAAAPAAAPAASASLIKSSVSKGGQIQGASLSQVVQQVSVRDGQHGSQVPPLSGLELVKPSLVEPILEVAATAATGASADSAFTYSTGPKSAYSSDQGLRALQPQQLQQEQKPQQPVRQQLSSYYQLLNGNEQPPTLDNEPVPSESLFAADGNQSTSTWQDYSSGGSTFVHDMSFSVPMQQPYLALGVEGQLQAWQQQQQQQQQQQAFVPQYYQQQVPYLNPQTGLPDAVGYPTAAVLAAHNFLEALEMATRPVVAAVTADQDHHHDAAVVDPASTRQ